MRQLGLILAVLACGCASDADMRETLRKYDEIPAASPAVVASPARSSKGASCDKQAARSVMEMMSDPSMARVGSTQAGWVIVHFGSDYSEWTPSQVRGMVTTFANADACIHGKARRIEFQSPDGAVIARADELRGIQMK
jgi:hypothetical protein